MSPYWLFFSAMAVPGVAVASSPDIRDQVLPLVDGTELRYGVSAPEVGDDTPPRPLVLALHFG